MERESQEGDIDLSTLLRSAHREMMKGVHTMLPGIIESFDTGTQRAKINLATAQQTIKGEKLSFPPLINVPIQFFRWGGFSISAPVKAGDECAVLFSERSMDLYLQQGEKDTVPNDARFFDLSDAFAIPALNSDKNLVPGYDPDNLVLQSDAGTIKLEITPDDSSKLYNENGFIELLSSGVVNINGATIAVDGTITSPTEVIAPVGTYDTSLTIAAKELNAHAHSGVTAGPSPTGPNI